MYSKFFSFIFACTLPLSGYAQFYTHGKINYVRTFNVQQAIHLESRYKWARQYEKKLPFGITSHFTLYFNKQKTDYFFQKDTEKSTQEKWLINHIENKNVAYKNQVLTNFETDSQQALKQIYEKDFLVSDHLQKFHWKIEDQIRVIAGYSCRKAVTTINDSVVVVAFYTDQIMVSGGPERFNGLPGMILGLAIPRLYLTWFATDVSFIQPKFAPLDLSKKTRQVSRTVYLKELFQGTKLWRGDKNTFFWLATL